jgi:hypothetical protein
MVWTILERGGAHVIERAAEVQRVVENRNADGGGALGPAWPVAKSFMHHPVYFLLKWFSIEIISRVKW